MSFILMGWLGSLYNNDVSAYAETRVRAIARNLLVYFTWVYEQKTSY
jgi:hypothetical protein